MSLFPHSLSISVMPLSGDCVLLKQGRDPLLTLGLPLTRRLSLSFLQDELLVGGLGLILVVDGPSHVLPQSDGDAVNRKQNVSGDKWIVFHVKKAHLSDSNSPCSSGGTVQRVRRLCLSSGVGFQKVSTVPVFLSLMKISLSCERNHNQAHAITESRH